MFYLYVSDWETSFSGGGFFLYLESALELEFFLQFVCLELGFHFHRSLLGFKIQFDAPLAGIETSSGFFDFQEVGLTFIPSTTAFAAFHHLGLLVDNFISFVVLPGVLPIQALFLLFTISFLLRGILRLRVHLVFWNQLFSG